MTRRYLYREGTPPQGGRALIHHGSTSWLEGDTPLMVDPPDGPAKVIGRVANLARDKDGWVTGDVMTHVPGAMDERAPAFAPVLINVLSRTTAGGQVQIVAAFLGGVMVVESCYRGWPEVGTEVET